MEKSPTTTPSSPSSLSSARAVTKLSSTRPAPRGRVLVCLLCLWAAFSLLLSACRAPASPTPQPSQPGPLASATATPTHTLTLPPSATFVPGATALPAASATPLPSATAPAPASSTVTVTPPPLALFQSAGLRPGITLESYLTDACQYLAMRWSPHAASPGAVVVPVMFHSIAQPGQPAPDPKDMTYEDFIQFMEYAHNQGFETITTAQLLQFLQYNTYIPERSMLLIVDDRRPGVIEEYFMPLLEKYDWTVTLAYIADPETFPDAMRRMQELNRSGRLDVQSHGLSGQLYITPDTPDDAIRSELLGAIPVLEEKFGQRPLAYIWPGGNFSPSAVQIARQGGYQLGFTVYSRGPILFNGIAQGPEERLLADPLMLLPRAWSRAMPVNLYEALQIGAEARQAALESYALEADYYRHYCGGELAKPYVEAAAPRR